MRNATAMTIKWFIEKLSKFHTANPAALAIPTTYVAFALYLAALPALLLRCATLRRSTTSRRKLSTKTTTKYEEHPGSIELWFRHSISSRKMRASLVTRKHDEGQFQILEPSGTPNVQTTQEPCVTCCGFVRLNDIRGRGLKYRNCENGASCPSMSNTRNERNDKAIMAQVKVALPAGWDGDMVLPTLQALPALAALLLPFPPLMWLPLFIVLLFLLFGFAVRPCMHACMHACMSTMHATTVVQETKGKGP